jgi:hypothetical protein
VTASSQYVSVKPYLGRIIAAAAFPLKKISFKISENTLADAFFIFVFNAPTARISQKDLIIFSVCPSRRSH